MSPLRRRRLGRVLFALAGVVACAVAVAGLLTMRRSRSRASPPAPAHLAASPPAPTGSGWPNPPARLLAPEVAFPPDFGVRRVYLDAGHGALGNPGNTSCFCVEEQDFTLFAADELGRRLVATGHFDVRKSRSKGQWVEYSDRVRDADEWGAEVFVSLHSDVRKKADRWSPEPGVDCPVSYGAPGFSVLYSDDGTEGEIAGRRRLAREMAWRLEEIGLLPYDGADYASLYEADPLEPGAFIDRHSPEQRIFVLYRPRMPAILIETHHALDPREASRWREPATLDAFSAAVAAALVDALSR